MDIQVLESILEELDLCETNMDGIREKNYKSLVELKKVIQDNYTQLKNIRHERIDLQKLIEDIRIMENKIV